MKKNEICHLSVDSHTSLQFDELISSYEQVFRIGRSMAFNFVTRRNTNKIVLNVSDQFATNNNCGFNLANFKLKFLKSSGEWSRGSRAAPAPVPVPAAVPPAADDEMAE